MNKHYDVIIIGGGIIGSSIAYFLTAQNNFQGSILIVEKDLSYSYCSTTLSVGGIRQQFSTPENIEISKFGVDFFKSAAHYLTVNGEEPDLSFQEAGYLFLATEAGLPVLKRNYDLQISHGVNVTLLNPDHLRKRFPWIQVSDLAAGCLGTSGEGWIDPYSLLVAFNKKAKDSSVKYLEDEVIDLKLQGNKIVKIGTKQNDKFSCGFLINAAGINAAKIANLVNIKLPVQSRKRFVYTFECQQKIPNCSLVIEPNGVYFRPEGDKFLCGVTPPEDQDPECCDFTMDYSLFENVVWPALAKRVKYFDKIKRGFSWAGHYAYNIIDQNAILGTHPEIENFIFANGFSGHGLQQAPAVGCAISELITYGCYKTLDLSRFSFERFEAGELIRERNVI